MEEIQRAAGVTRKAPKRSASPVVEDKKAPQPVLNPLEITDSEDNEGEGSDDEFGGFDDRIAGSDVSNDEEDDSMDDRPAPSKPKASSFIPSLSVGYVAGSGSEPESDIEELAPAKKNRRGQRARQQIAEKKYGAKAKHLANPKNDRNAGWDMKRGATDGGKGKRGGVAGARGGFSKGHAAGHRNGGGEAPVPPKKKHKDDEGPIHPSWAAAKAAKEKKNAPVAFTGKKISFD